MNKEEDLIELITEMHNGFEKYKSLLSPDRVSYACINYGIALAFNECADYETACSEVRYMVEDLIKNHGYKKNE